MSRKIGIVGGIGWRSTADYYAAIHELAPRAFGGGSHIELSIESLDLALAASLLADGERDGRWEGFDNYHRAALLRLERSEVEIGLIACNTPHERLQEIRRGTGLELVDLFDAAAAEAERRKPDRLLVLGTPTVLRSRRLMDRYAERGIRTVTPLGETSKSLDRLIHDLQSGPVPKASDKLKDLIISCGWTPGSNDLVALHCTELPLAFGERGRSPAFDHQGLRFLNASMIHVGALLEKAFIEPGGAAAAAASRRPATLAKPQRHGASPAPARGETPW